MTVDSESGGYPGRFSPQVVERAGTVALAATVLWAALLVVGTVTWAFSTWPFVIGLLILWPAQGVAGGVCLAGGIPQWRAAEGPEQDALKRRLVRVGLATGLVQGLALLGVLTFLGALASMGR